MDEGVWVGFRPRVVGGGLRGVSECRSGALGESAGVGLGLRPAGGRL